MNVNNVIEIFSIIKDLSDDIVVMAIGGYPSLVTQNILKESRETKDIDITIFIEKQRVDNVVDNIYQNIFHNLSCDERFNVIRKNISESYGARSKQYENLKHNIGLNSSYYMEIYRNPKVRCKFDDVEFASLISGSSKYKSDKLTKIYNYYKSISNPSIDRLDNIMNGLNINKISVDLFVMDLDKIKTNTIDLFNNGNLFTRYYPILKAKYEYCLNYKTNSKDYEKHKNDLIESFNVVRIKGINYPEDIERIEKNREDNNEENIESIKYKIVDLDRALRDDIIQGWMNTISSTRESHYSTIGSYTYGLGTNQVYLNNPDSMNPIRIMDTSADTTDAGEIHFI